jgi:hypothetical protein
LTRAAIHKVLRKAVLQAGITTVSAARTRLGVTPSRVVHVEGPGNGQPQLAPGLRSSHDVWAANRFKRLFEKKITDEFVELNGIEPSGSHCSWREERRVMRPAQRDWLPPSAP